MGFEVFLSCYQNGEPSGIEKNRLREVFGPDLVYEGDEGSYWHLQYGNEIESCDVYLTPLETDSTRIHGLTVSRPVGEQRLWDSLFRIMQLGNVVFFFPGGQLPLIANEDTAHHLLPDLVEALGEPELISSGLEIMAAVKKG